MIKTVFNFKCIYRYACVTYYFFFVFNFKCIHAFTWVTY